MAMRTPIVEAPIKAPEIEPSAGGEVRFDLKIPNRQEENTAVEKGTSELASGVKEMNASFEKQAEFAVQNQYEAQLVSAKNAIVGKAKTYQGTDVLGAVKPAQDDFDKASQEISKNITDTRQKDAFNLLSDRYKKSLDDEVGQHVAENIPKVYAQHFGNLLNAKMGEVQANWNSPSNLKSINDDLNRISDQHANAVGLDDERKTQTRQAIHEQYLDNLIQANVDHSKARDASTLLENAHNNGEVSGDFYNKEKEALRSHLDLADATEIFAGSKDVKGIKGNSRFFGTGGFPKEDSIQAYIQAKYGATKEDPMGGDYEKADRVFKQVMNLARADQEKKQRGQENSLRAYENAMQTMHDKFVKTGDPQYDLSHAQNMATNYKWDKVSQTDMENKAAAFYAAPTKETEAQARAAEALKVAIHTGQPVTNDDLQKHYERGDITAQKMKTLMGENDEYQETGKGGDRQFAYGRAHQMFMDYFSDKSKADNAMSELINDTKGKTSSEIQKVALDKLDLIKKVPLDKLLFTGTKAPSGSDLKTAMNYQRTFNTIVGSDQTKYLMESIASRAPKGQQTDFSDLAVFASRFPNGMDDLAIGQPANNAIQSLRQHGEPVSYDAIQKVLERTPDGIY